MSASTKMQRWLGFFAIAAISLLVAGCKAEEAIGKTDSPTPAFGPTLAIKVAAPGLSAEEVASQIAAPIEKQIATLESLPLVEAICTTGQAEFLLHTKADCNLKQLESIIRDRLASARESLPQSVADAGLQIQTQSVPSFIVAVYSPEGTHDLVTLGNYAQKELRDQLTRIPGVSEVVVLGTNHPGDGVLVKQYPGVALLLAPTVDAKPAEVANALKQRLAELRTELPAGLLLTFPINAASSEANESNLMVELQLPAGVEQQQKLDALKQACAKLQASRGIKNLVAFTRHPLEADGQSVTIVLSLTASDTEGAAQRTSIKQLLAAIPATNARIKNFAKRDAAALRVAISGPEVKATNDLAGKFASQLRQAGKHQVDHLRSPLATSPRIIIKLDPSKLSTLGISSGDLAANLSEALKHPLKDDPTRGIIALPNDVTLSSPRELAQLRVKNAAGQEFPLSEVANVETIPTKMVVYRVNNHPAILLAAETSEEPTGKLTREQIDSQFLAARNALNVGEEFRLIWLDD